MPEPKIIAIEEHFTSPALRAILGQTKAGPIQAKLDDFCEIRLRDMDEAGIDLEVLSENNPAAQNLDPETAVKTARASNDYLQEIVHAHPTRFAGFAALPTPAPKDAADELERAVTKLGFKGAMIMGTTNGAFIDEAPFRPIFERAAKLDVPVYIHPSPVMKSVMDTYFKGQGALLSGSPLGFGLETLAHTFRLITSGLFDNYPTLKIIVGHLGETAPFTLWRTDENIGKVLKLPKAFRDYYKQHFYLTTSGAFSDSALQCSITEMGIERIMFAVDWPYIHSPDGTKWLKTTKVVNDADRAAIASGNAKKLLKL